MPTGEDIGLFDKQAQGVEGLTVAANSWDGVTDGLAKRYRSDYTYDANGNIQTAQRYGNEDVDANGEADQYDDLRYSYEKSSGNLLRNRLYHLNETKYGGYGDIGIDISGYHNAHEDVNLLNNYKYDELGNLIADKREQIANIEWTVSGKVKHITRASGSTKPELWFAYGADGQRTSKTVGDPLNGGYREWYVRDAQGNVMAMYKYADNGASLEVTERPIYGSNRLGSYAEAQQMLVATAVPANYAHPMLAARTKYELTDHLGNVRATVSGLLVPSGNPASAFEPHLLSEMAYEPFGSLLPGRNYSSSNYRFGFQGQGKDDEIFGSTGTALTAEFWEYDTRTGRRWNLDPVPQVDISDYAAFGLNPITNVDPNGDYFFGLFGSTSAQRQAADKHAAENNGTVVNRHSKNIGDSFLAQKGVGSDGVGFGVQELQQFNKDGSAIPLEGTISENVSGLMDSWSESQNFLGSASYSMADGTYMLLQSNPIGRIIGGSNVEHLNGSIADNNEVVEGSVTSLPIPGAGLLGASLRTTKGLSKAGVTALARTVAYDIPGHGAERLLQRGISEKMAQVAIKRGERFFDPKNGTVNYLLRGGFASGKDLLIGTNAINGSIKTGIRGSNLLRPRMIPMR